MLWILLAHPSSPDRSAVRASTIEYKHVAAAGGDKARARGERKAMRCAGSSEDNSVVAVGAPLGHTTQVASPRSMTLAAGRRPARCRVNCRRELDHHWMLREPSIMAQPPSQEIGKADSWIEEFHLEAVARTWHKRSPAAFGERAEFSLGGTALFRQLPSTVAGPTGRRRRPSTWPD